MLCIQKVTSKYSQHINVVGVKCGIFSSETGWVKKKKKEAKSCKKNYLRTLLVVFMFFTLSKNPIKRLPDVPALSVPNPPVPTEDVLSLIVLTNIFFSSNACSVIYLNSWTL